MDGEDTLPCEVCGKSVSFSDFERHQMMCQGGGLAAIPCEICGTEVSFGEYEVHLHACEERVRKAPRADFHHGDVMMVGSGGGASGSAVGGASGGGYLASSSSSSSSPSAAFFAPPPPGGGGGSKGFGFGGGDRHHKSASSSSSSSSSSGGSIMSKSGGGGGAAGGGGGGSGGGGGGKKGLPPMSPQLAEQVRRAHQASLEHVAGRAHSDLEAVLLSAATCTENDEVEHPIDVPSMSQKEIEAIFRSSVQGIDKMRDRTGAQPVLKFIVSTYSSGLPAYAGSVMHEHIIKAMRYIMHAMSTAKPNDRTTTLTRLAEAYQSCQAVQSRVIDAVFGLVSGRDKGLREQVLFLLDDEKQRVLDETTVRFYPNAPKAGDGNPSQQMPHIQSAYKRTIGRSLGLRGQYAASVDTCAPMLSAQEMSQAECSFRESFRVEEFADVIVGDVNQPNSAPGGRRINRETLMQWAGSEGASRGFDPHSIFFEEERKQLYNDAKPIAGEEFQPFLHRAVAIDMLRCLFNVPKK